MKEGSMIKFLYQRNLLTAVLTTLILSNLTAARIQSVLIADFGAIGDGKTRNTRAIQAAIDQCAAAGGGTIVIPAGTFLTGSVFFKQGADLHLEKNAVLKGTVDPSDYPQVPTRWEGEEKVWTAALVNFFDMKDVDITGPGCLDGSGDAWMERYPRGSRELKKVMVVR